MRVAVVFGGRSGEHEVSVVSARSVAAALREESVEVVPMAIDRRGRWAPAAEAARILEDSGDRIDQVLEVVGADAIDPRLLDGSVDVVFPVLHGPYGEDGAIQGLLQMLDLPYVGCDVVASAVCMDKVVCSRIVEQAGLVTPAWCEVTSLDWVEGRSGVVDRCFALGERVFVKPARLGSSVGITAATSPEELAAGLDRAFSYGSRVIVERAVEARELEVAVLGNERPEASCAGEVIPGHEFYDYADKYLDDSCQLLAPAPLDPGTAERVRELAVCDVSRAAVLGDGSGRPVPGARQRCLDGQRGEHHSRIHRDLHVSAPVAAQWVVLSAAGGPAGGAGARALRS